MTVIKMSDRELTRLGEPASDLPVRLKRCIEMIWQLSLQPLGGYIITLKPTLFYTTRLARDRNANGRLKQIVKDCCVIRRYGAPCVERVKIDIKNQE